MAKSNITIKPRVGAQSLYDGQKFVGRIEYGRYGVTAFDANNNRIGLFRDCASAITAVCDPPKAA